MTDRSTRHPAPWLATDALVGLTVLAAMGWAVAALTDGRSAVQAVPAATSILVLGTALVIRSRSGLPQSTPVLPRWFAPVVVLVAAGSAIGWGVGDGAIHGTQVGVAALIMASPAAAMIAVPAAFMTGASRARSAGVNLANLPTLEATTVVDTLVLAKDGTLTTGDLTVISVDPVEPDHDRNLRWFAGALSKASDQRVEKAVATLSARGRLSGVQVVDGLGVQGSVDRHPVRVGSPQWIGFEPEPTIWTTVGVEVDGRTLGSITVADDVRPDLVRDVQRLTDLGLSLVLVSGDTEERTQHVAALAGIDTFHITDDPTGVVGELVSSGRRVATAGLPDTVGAMLAVTTQASGTSSAPTIVGTDCSPARVADAIALGRSTAARIRRVRTVTTALALIGLAVAATGIVGPVVAAATGIAVAIVAAALATSG